jgi:hypothetical protein
MSIFEIFFQIILPTAVLSSLFTAILIYLMVPKLYKKNLKKDLDEIPKEIGKEVEIGVIRAAKSLLPQFEERVKSGFLKGLTDVTSLPTNFAANFIQSSLENLGLFKGDSKKIHDNDNLHDDNR